MTDRPFPPPWAVEKVLGGGFVVRDATGQSLAYVISKDNPSDARTAKMLTEKEAEWVASNIAKLPDLLGIAEAVPIAELWTSADPDVWQQALTRYWSYVRPENLDLERSLESLDLERLRRMDSRSWYEFLRDEYFVWKYTAAHRYASTTRQLERYIADNALDELDAIRTKLLALDTDDIRSSLATADEIRGLGIAGASGLLSLMYPEKFATVDQFVVKALNQVDGLPEAESIAEMEKHAENLSIRDGLLLIEILRRKAADNNRLFNSTNWTPRKVDMVLWTYGRD
jgi:hypothetical protein